MVFTIAAGVVLGLVCFCFIGAIVQALTKR